MNGVFDLKIASRGPRVVSVTRDGIPVPITQDASRGVTSIGRPAAVPGAPGCGPGRWCAVDRRQAVPRVPARRYTVRGGG